MLQMFQINIAIVCSSVSFDPVMLSATSDNVTAEIFTLLVSSDGSAQIGRLGASSSVE